MNVFASHLSPKPQRVALLRVAPETFLGLLKWTGEHRITQRGIPADAEVVGAFYDYEQSCVILKLKSVYFDIVVHGAVIPYVDIMLTDHGPWGDPPTEVLKQ